MKLSDEQLEDRVHRCAANEMTAFQMVKAIVTEDREMIADWLDSAECYEECAEDRPSFTLHNAANKLRGG